MAETPRAYLNDVLTPEQYNQTVWDAMSETTFLTQTLRESAQLGWLCHHIFEQGKRIKCPNCHQDIGGKTYARRTDKGFPDLMLVHPKSGRTLWAELKSEKGKVSANQKVWLNALALQNEEVYLWYPHDTDVIVDTLNVDFTPYHLAREATLWKNYNLAVWSKYR